jgi:peptidoglycan/LPS O-acetylase OafA/YrhL
VSAERPHLRHLDGLRALAALYVVLHHVWLTIWPAPAGHALPTETAALAGVLAFGHLAVAVFIVLSGFCLTLPVVRDGGLAGGARRFFARRARRILPPFYAALALSLVLIWTVLGEPSGTHWDIAIPVDAAGYVGNALLLQDMVGQSQANHVFWSIAVEWQIYLAFPLLVLLWSRLGPLRAAVAGIGVALVLALAVGTVREVGPFVLAGLTPQFLALFVLGMLAATIAASPARRWRVARDALPWAPVSLALAIGVAATCVLLGREHVLEHLVGVDLLVGLAVGSSLVAASRPGAGRLRAALGSPLPYFLGSFAYSTYLVHAPLLELWWRSAIQPLGLSSGTSFAALALTGVPFVLALSYGFFLLVERRCLSKGQSAAAAEARARLRPRFRRPPPLVSPQFENP